MEGMKMDKTMNKPLTMIVNETKIKLVNICNESGLPPIILDLIVQGVYSDIHYIVEKQAADEEAAYLKSLEENKIQNSKGDDNEQKTK
jgi:hypothetical protein